jgi:protein-tyrosine phosphatase
VKPIEPFVDIHCHLLPGIDDGPASTADAMAMAEMAASDGIGTVIATPHQLGNHANNTAAAIRETAARFGQRLQEVRLPTKILPGADVRIEPDLPQRIRRDEVLTLADHGRHVLLELPHEVYVPLDRLLGGLQSVGLTGILSHPERNRGILKQPDVLKPLVMRGCLMQVTAGSFLGNFGEGVQRFAQWMLEQGLIHFIATDAHGIATRPPRMRQAFDRVAELAGFDRALLLCCRNPACVAEGKSVRAGPCKTACIAQVPHLAGGILSFFLPKRRKTA